MLDFSVALRGRLGPQFWWREALGFINNHNRFLCWIPSIGFWLHLNSFPFVFNLFKNSCFCLENFEIFQVFVYFVLIFFIFGIYVLDPRSELRTLPCSDMKILFLVFHWWIWTWNKIVLFSLQNSDQMYNSICLRTLEMFLNKNLKLGLFWASVKSKRMWLLSPMVSFCWFYVCRPFPVDNYVENNISLLFTLKVNHSQSTVWIIVW